MTLEQAKYKLYILDSEYRNDQRVNPKTGKEYGWVKKNRQEAAQLKKFIETEEEK